jgi:integrase
MSATIPAPWRFLTLQEILQVLDDIRRRGKRSLSTRMNLVVFRLACGCGLRRKEIAGLVLSDLILTGPKPCVHVRAEITKGKKGQKRPRNVPLWWDKGTLADLQRWFAFRQSHGAGPNDPLICGTHRHNVGKPLTGMLIAHRWRSAIRVLGKDRIRQLSVHTGRHTFASIALQTGHSLVEVRDAMGHADISTTSIYLHAIVRDDLPDLFSMPSAGVSVPLPNRNGGVDLGKPKRRRKAGN